MQGRFKWLCLAVVLLSLVYLALTNRYAVETTAEAAVIMKYDRWTGRVMLLGYNRTEIMGK